MAETAFSEDGKYYSAISQDGRLRIWDTEANVLKQEYTPDLHLTSPPSCLQWITVTQSAGAQKPGRRKSLSEQEIQCIALGTTSGKILIYSVAQAKVETVLEDSKNSEIQQNGIVALDWHRKYGLYSCSKEGFLCEWDLQSGEISNKYNVIVDSKNKQASVVSAIKIVPHSQKTPARYIITASTQVKLWRLHNGEAEVIKCLGHNAAPKAILELATLNNTCWLIEGSQTERLLSFWDVTITQENAPLLNGDSQETPNKKKRRKSSAPITIPTPTYNFVLEDAPKNIDLEAKGEDGGVRLRIAAATRSGVVHYYGHMLNGASTKPIKPSVTIQVSTPDGQPLPLQSVRLASNGALLVSRLHGVHLSFEKVIPETKSKTQVLIRGEATESKKRSKSNDANKVRADTSTKDVTYIEPLGGVSRKRNTPGGKVEVPMEERLANLTVDLKTRDGPAGHKLTRLLVQALHSNDQKLIQTVLRHNKPSVALQTVAALSPEYVTQLLKQLAEIATRDTAHCAAVCTWVTATVRCHAAFLLATGGHQHSDPLTHLLAIFTHRRSHLCQLLNLKGRLELTISQREKREDVNQQPILEYNDTSSDDSDMEVEKALSESSHSWGEPNSGSGSGHSDHSTSDSDHGD